MDCNSKIKRTSFRVKYWNRLLEDTAAFQQHMNAQQLLNQLDPTGEIRRRRKKNKIKRSRFRVKSSTSPKRPKRLAPKVVRRKAPKLVRQTNDSYDLPTRLRENGADWNIKR